MSVANVETISPPMTARPSGADCDPASPKPIAIGTMPKIMAAAVMRIARKRLVAPTCADWRTEFPPRRNRSEKLTNKMELATAIPIAMIAPMND